MNGEVTTSFYGNLVDDPELRYTVNGKAVVQIRVASQGRRRDGDAWVDTDPTFLSAHAWGPPRPRYPRHLPVTPDGAAHRELLSPPGQQSVARNEGGHSPELAPFLLPAVYGRWSGQRRSRPSSSPPSAGNPKRRLRIL